MTDSTTPRVIPRSRPVRLLLRTLLALLFMLGTWLAWSTLTAKPRGIRLTDSWQFREPPPARAIGDLGGAPVHIPPEFAHHLEYNDDPGLFEERKGPVPERTFQSPIRSFGFNILFPEMVGVTPATAPLKRATSMETSMWLFVGVSAHRSYLGERFLQSMGDALDDPKEQRIPIRRTPGEVFGLVAYAPVKAKGDPQENFRWHTRFVHRDAQDRVDTYIECYEEAFIYTPCTLHMDLRPAMRATVTVSFRKDMLPDWHAIQQSVKKVLLSFRDTPAQLARLQPALAASWL